MSDYMKKLCRRILCYFHIRILQTRNTDTIIFYYMTTYSPDNSYFRVTVKVPMAQLHNTNFLKASSVKVQDIMLTSAYISWNYADLTSVHLS